MIGINKNESQDAARETFNRYLKQRGIKLTAPRRRILDVVLDLSDHFEAEQLVYALSRQGHRVAKATVYRTLPLLVDCGILKQVRFDVKQAFYERSFGEAVHDHLVCQECGRIIEFASQKIIDLRDQLAHQHGFQAASHRFQITGRCADCRDATNR